MVGGETGAPKRLPPDPRPRFLEEVFAKRDFGLALLFLSVLWADLCILLGMDLLSDLLVAVGGELCGAGAHDGVGGGDVGLLSPTRNILTNCSSPKRGMRS